LRHGRALHEGRTYGDRRSLLPFRASGGAAPLAPRFACATGALHEGRTYGDLRSLLPILAGYPFRGSPNPHFRAFRAFRGSPNPHFRAFRAFRGSPNPHFRAFRAFRGSPKNAPFVYFVCFVD